MSGESIHELLKTPPPDMPLAIIEALKKEVRSGVSTILGVDKEKGPFMLYLLGNNYAEIADQTGWSMSIILLTALKYRWYEKKTVFEMVDKNTIDKKAGTKHVLKTTVNAILSATAQVVLKQMQQVMKGEIAPQDCKYLPKDIYGLEKFISVVNQVHHLNESANTTSVQNINVQVANLPSSSSSSITASSSRVEELPSPAPIVKTLDEFNSMSREERLKSLQSTFTPRTKNETVQ